MHDAISLERRATPSVAVITHAFVDGAELMAKTCGASQYGFAVIDHPISSATPGELAVGAEEIVAQAEALLLRR